MRGRTAMLLAALCALPAPAMAQDDGFRARLPEDEVIYFVLPDRFDNADPANDKGGSRATGSRPAMIPRPRVSTMAATSRG